MALGLRGKFVTGALVIGAFASGAWMSWHHLRFGIPFHDLFAYWYFFFAFLLLLALPLAAGFHYWVLRPIELINSYAPPIERGELEGALIPAEDIPGDELGRLMLIRNRVVEAVLKMNEARKQELEFVRTVIDSMEDSVCIIKIADLSIVDANKALLASVGAKREEVVGRKCHEVLHGCLTPCRSPAHACPLDDLLLAKTVVREEHTHAGKDGRARIVEVSAHPIMDPAGGVLQVVHISRDVTAQREIVTL
ncbi:MAG: PAS domain-containing protein, partial [Elusimicrobia bacterium]|nr:PAS domain-containing protein [Elusimicrobiota bacterium]